MFNSKCIEFYVLVISKGFASLDVGFVRFGWRSVLVWRFGFLVVGRSEG